MSTRPSALMVHPSAELYGSDRMFAESVAALAERGWRVVVALPQDGPLIPALAANDAEVVCCPTPVLRKSALRPAGMARLLATGARSLRPMVRLLRRVRPDVVYVNTVTVPAWLVVAKLYRRPVLAHIHEAEDGVPALIRAGLATPLLAARTIVVNSRATARTLHRSLPRLARRTQLVYNGVPGPPRPAHRPDRPADPVRIVLVGRLSPRKGTDLAVDAVAGLHRAGHRVRLDLVGSAFDGYEWFVDELRSRIAAAGLNGRVRLCGFQADVWQAYAGADVALVPSRAEPFGNAAVEARLAGVPVVVTGVQGLPEAVGDGEFGTVVPTGDPAALAAAISELLADWPATRRTADAARRDAETRFAPQRYRADIAALVTDLVG